MHGLVFKMDELIILNYLQEDVYRPTKPVCVAYVHSYIYVAS